jgi:hypothetical protein
MDTQSFYLACLRLGRRSCSAGCEPGLKGSEDKREEGVLTMDGSAQAEAVVEKGEEEEGVGGGDDWYGMGGKERGGLTTVSSGAHPQLMSEAGLKK